MGFFAIFSDLPDYIKYTIIAVLGVQAVVFGGWAYLVRDEFRSEAATKKKFE
eukprot:CAMPEP_0194048722 /NCGR_PEP_ID=MMETSP0009_2-20130614/28279_1 /TAXON_ID=210454 /ORGANISM="Grammatophora oceanica, Strain CCMP 410" /LENGTH=51 /DNA_ID=CAMNT_0038694673 /DNA_START=137 /DNA_END=292 /DNA_ORIENTATION=-